MSQIHKSVLNAIAVERTLAEQKIEDIKSEGRYELTHMDSVKKHRDFSKITKKDLNAVFLQLKARCPNTWTTELEIRAKELNDKFMTLRMGNTAVFIDPDLTPIEAKTDEPEIQRLMTAPELWSMDTPEQALEFSDILRHFTIYAHFEGRPFVRA